jgi:hypothetical protein
VEYSEKSVDKCVDNFVDNPQYSAKTTAVVHKKQIIHKKKCSFPQK